jgi:hypothetical protein
VRFFDVGQRAEGFIAIGQEAVGVIAIGQLAIGFIAIGQLARGVFVVGQLAVGVVVVGQLAFGVWGAVGMMAVAGRWVKGLGYAIWPKPDDELNLPKAIPLEDVKNGQPGFVEVELELEDGEPRIVYDGEPVEVELEDRVATLIGDVIRTGYPHALVRIEQKERLDRGDDVGYRQAAPMVRYLVANKAVGIPRPEWQTGGYWGKAVLRTALIGALAVAWFVVVGIPFWNELFATKTTLLPELFGSSLL